MKGIAYEIERFPGTHNMDDYDTFCEMFESHGIEARSKPLDLNWDRYAAIEREGRLVWVVARSGGAGLPLGYSCHWSYRDMHFHEIVAVDDMWYVMPHVRRHGIGRELKNIGHAALRKAGAVKVYDAIRTSGPDIVMMQKLGYELWGYRWVKDLSAIGRDSSGD